MTSNPLKWHEVTHLRFENFVGQAYTLHIYNTDDYDWCSNTDRPNKNFNGVTIKPAEAITKDERINRYASECPFTVDFTFADGLTCKGVRFCQKNATNLDYSFTQPVKGKDGKTIYEITDHSDKNSKTLIISVTYPMESSEYRPFKVGKSDAFIRGVNILEHSYLVSYKRVDYASFLTRYACFGDSNPNIESKNCVLSGSCHEALARNICTFNPDDTEVLLNRSKTKEFPTFPKTGDSGGMLYGWHGVCHTLANRLLLATNRDDMTVNDYVNGGSLSLSLYGYWGKSNLMPESVYKETKTRFIDFPSYYSMCEHLTSTYQAGNPVDMAAFWGSELCEAGREGFISRIKYYGKHSTNKVFSELVPVEVENWNSEAAIDDVIAQKRLDIIARYQLGGEYDSGQINRLADSLGDFMRAKMGWDTKLDAQMVAANARPDDSFLNEFADDINRRFMVFLANCREVLGDDRFNMLFDLIWTDDFQLLDKSMLIPESPDDGE